MEELAIFFQNGGIRNFVVVGLRNFSKMLLFANFGAIGNLYSKMVKFANLWVDLGTKYLKPNKISYKICLLFFLFFSVFTVVYFEEHSTYSRYQRIPRISSRISRISRSYVNLAVFYDYVWKLSY